MKYVHEYMWRTANKMTSSYRIEDSEWRDLKVDDVIVMRDEETLIELWFVKEEDKYEHWAKRIIKNYCDLKCHDENIKLLVTDLKWLFPKQEKVIDKKDYLEWCKQNKRLEEETFNFFRYLKEKWYTIK